MQAPKWFKRYLSTYFLSCFVKLFHILCYAILLCYVLGIIYTLAIKKKYIFISEPEPQRLPKSRTSCVSSVLMMKMHVKVR